MLSDRVKTMSRQDDQGGSFKKRLSRAKKTKTAVKTKKKKATAASDEEALVAVLNEAVKTDETEADAPEAPAIQEEANPPEVTPEEAIAEEVSLEEASPEEAIADEAGIMETSQVEESNGFQIFKSGTTADRDPDQAGSGMTANPDTGNSDTGNPESGNPAGNANMDQLNAEVSRWMTNAVRSIVRDEMQQKVDAIARSAVRKALAEFDPKKD